MDREIIYSFKEYQEKYSSSLHKCFLQYEEIEEIDFIITEIEKYNICLQIINFPIQVAFNKFFRIEYGSNLKTFSIPQEIFDFIFANQNADYYYKIYSDLIGSIIQSPSTMKDGERKIKQTRLIFPKIISFLETKKNKLESELKTEDNKHENIFSNNGFKLFDYILDTFIKPKGVTGRQSDLICYHRKMYDNNPQYIHKKPTDFFNWFDKEYSETSGQLVTFDRVKTDQREKDYSSALEWFKHQE